MLQLFSGGDVVDIRWGSGLRVLLVLRHGETLGTGRDDAMVIVMVVVSGPIGGA